MLKMTKEDIIKLFCDISTGKGKKIITGNLPGIFYFENWYNDQIRFDDDGRCHVLLRDLARHGDFYGFINEMQSENTFEIIISDTISLRYCEWALGEEYEGIGLTEGDWAWSPEGDKWKTELLLSVALELNSILSHYTVVVEDAKLCVKAIDDVSKQGIIHKDSLFKEDMDKVKAYFDEHGDDILQKLKLAAKEEKKARWYKESVMGMVANKLKEIISSRGEHFSLFVDPTTNTYKNEIIYNGRRLSIWAVYPYSEVGDYDIGDPVYYAKLADIVLCPEFKQAIEEVRKEEGIVIHSTDSIDLNDCLLVAGQSLIDYEGMAKRFHLETEADLWKFWVGVCDDLFVLLTPEFNLRCNNSLGNVKLLLMPDYLRRRDILDCSPMFKEQMQKVADFFDKHFK